MAVSDFYISNAALKAEIVGVMARYGVVNPWLAVELANLLDVQVVTTVDAAYTEADALP